jgi:hypothetical protein
VMRDGWPDCSLSWAFVLLSPNMRCHFFTSDSLLTPPPSTAISWR